MSTGQTADSTTKRDRLESQLEKLFSDFEASDAALSTDRHPELQPFAKSSIAAPASAFKAAAKDPAPEIRSRRTSQPRWRSGLLTSVAVAVLTAGVILVSQGKPAHSGIISPTPEIVGRVAPSTSPTPTPTPAPEIASPSPFPATATPTRPTNTATATIRPTMTSESVTLVPTSPQATDTRTAVPSPTSPPATATLARAQSILPATTTPVLPQAIGLETIPTPVPRISMPDKTINIVLLGSDQRPQETFWRTDVVIVVSVNPDLPSVSMLSIPRDTWLYIPNWTYQRINLADSHGDAVSYPGGGPGLIKATIEYNFGIHVDYYARVDFAGLMRIVDALGGIDVLLDCPVEDGFPDDPITEDPSVVTQISYPVPGIYHLDGKHALWLARSRKTTSEFARSRRQHRILQAIWNKANQLGYIADLPELWAELTTTVDTDLSLDNVLWLASIGLRLELSQITSGFIDGRYLTAWVSPGGANVLLPQTESILEAVQQLFNPYPYKAPQGLSQVEIWNGSGSKDMGLIAADKLLRNGFEVAGIRDADQLYEESVIVAFAAATKGSPLPLLQRLFNANVTETPTRADAQSENPVPYLLIIGANYQPCEWPTAARWEPTPTPTTSP